MTRPPQPDPTELAGYEVVVGICGGIAAYKVATLVSSLVQRGAGVTVAMTDAAQKFITPLTFQSLTARQVFTDLWQSENYYDPQHLNLTEKADAFVIAPATANMIGKIARGLADDLLSTMVMSAACPVLLAPGKREVFGEARLPHGPAGRRLAGLPDDRRGKDGRAAGHPDQRDSAPEEKPAEVGREVASPICANQTDIKATPQGPANRHHRRADP